MHSRQQLADDFRKLGVRARDVVMLHASVRALGEVAGGPDQIHLALRDALTNEGTLIMYASCPRYYDEVGRGNLRPEQENEILEKLYRVPVLQNGKRVWRDMEEFDTGDRAHANWPDRFFAKIVDTFLAQTKNAGGRVGHAVSGPANCWITLCR